MFAHVSRLVRLSVVSPNGLQIITQERLGLGSGKFIGTLVMTEKMTPIDFHDSRLKVKVKVTVT